jgi:hypothetical protein
MSDPAVGWASRTADMICSAQSFSGKGPATTTELETQSPGVCAVYVELDWVNSR